MDILITDLHDASNRGDAAILEGVINSLQSEFEQCNIKVKTGNPDSARNINNVDCEKQKHSLFSKKNLKINLAIIYLLLGMCLGSLGRKLPFIEKIINKLSLNSYFDAEIIVMTGGSNLTDFYSPSYLGRYWGLLFAKLIGKPVVIYAQSIGPLDKHKWISKFVLNRLDLITVRDKNSKEVLESIGVDPSKVMVAADAAFAMDLKNEKEFLRYNLETVDSFFNKNKLKVSISVRKWSHYKNEEGHKNYIGEVAKTADWLIREKNAQVFFASTCTGFAGYRTDDRITAYEVINQMEEKNNNVSVLSGEYSPQKLSGFYSEMDLHIGTRMHSNILAMIGKTVVVPIQYEFKTSGLMELFGIENVIDINKISSKELMETILFTLSKRDIMRKKIIDKLPEMKLNAHKPARLIKELLEKHV